jgi:hypothetical protein
MANDTNGETSATRAALKRVADWWNGLSESEKSWFREQGLSKWDAFWMSRRCGTRRQRASDVCEANGNGNGNGNGTGSRGPMVDLETIGRGGGRIGRRAETVRFNRLMDQAKIVPNTVNPGFMPASNGNGNGNGNGDPELWYMQPAFLAGGALLAFLLFSRRRKAA